jgi:Rne/Rng family ribonuclease
MALLRDRAGGALRRIVIDDRRALAAAQAYCRDHAPGLESLLQPHDGAGSLFAAYGVDDEVAAALEPEVPLACGGRVIIEPTAALTAIDVDAGPAPARRANLEAAAEIGRQIRLRGLAGQILIDFVSTRDREARDEALDALRAALAFDGADSNLFGFTRLGLVEMTRRRTRPGLAEVLGGATAAEAAALDLIRETLRAARTAAGRRSQIKAPRAVVELLRGPMAGAWREVESRLGRAVALEAEE